MISTRALLFTALLLGSLTLAGCTGATFPASPNESPAAGGELERTEEEATPTDSPSKDSTPIATVTPLPVWTPTPALSPTASPSPTPSVVTTRLEFEPGATGLTVEGTLHVGERQRFLLRALAGQIMRVYIEPPGATLGVFEEEGAALKSAEDYNPFWRGELPSTGDYVIEVMHSELAIGPWDRPLLLSILINPPGEARQWLEYGDPARGYKLSYSDYFALGRTPDPLQEFKTEAALTLIFTGTEYFQGTNLADVHFVVGTSDDSDLLASCASPSHPNRETPAGQIEVDGVPFQRSETGGVAAGNHYEFIFHRGASSDTCYEFLYYLHSFSVGAYPAGEVEEFDREGVLKHLGLVLDSVRFIEE